VDRRNTGCGPRDRRPQGPPAASADASPGRASAPGHAPPGRAPCPGGPVRIGAALLAAAIALPAGIAASAPSQVLAAPGAVPASRRPPGPPRVDNRSTTVYGSKIHYLESGYGQPIVLLHGLGGGAESLRPLVALLAPKHHVYAPDQLGFGGSDKPLIDYRITTLVEFLHGFLDAVGLERPDLLGHALGARVASLYALEHPGRVGRLVLLSGAGYRPALDDETARALAFATIADARRALLLAYADDHRATDAAAERLFVARMRGGSAFAVSRLVASFESGDGFADDLSPIEAPTLIAWGRDDAIAPLSQGEKAHRQIKGSRLVIFDHCGHLPMEEAATPLEEALRAFLDPTTAGPTR
jgi:2-hydroxy-6-oxonona-2,4-dienedioate hydrolase